MSSTESGSREEEIMDTEAVLVKVKVGGRTKYLIKLCGGEGDDDGSSWISYEPVTSSALITAMEQVIREKEEAKRVKLEKEKRTKELEEKKRKLNEERNQLNQRKRKLDEELAELEAEEKKLKLTETQQQPQSAPESEAKNVSKRDDTSLPKLTSESSGVQSLRASRRTVSVMTTPTKEPANDKLPRLPLSAFFLFSHDERPRIRKRNPELAFGEVTKELEKLWSEADLETKKRYEAMAEEDKKRYSKEKQVFRGLRRK